MQDLMKSLLNIRDLIKAIKAVAPAVNSIPKLPEIKAPSKPSLTPKTNAVKMPGLNPQSNKDPKKIAEQIKNGSMSTKTQKVMLKTDSVTGQWRLEPTDPS